MNMERLTERSREAVSNAHDLAVKFDHQYLMPLHLLAAMLEQEDGLVPALLQKLGVMHDLELVAELRVVVRQRVHAVRTLGQNFTHAVLL